MDELIFDIELKYVFIKLSGPLKAVHRIGIAPVLQQ